MPLDLEYLRRHYASLSDDALLALDRADLVEAARGIFDEEVHQRELARLERPARARRLPDQEVDDTDWLEDAAEAYSRYAAAGAAPAPEAVDARNILEAANIPCHLELYQEPEEERGDLQYRWRVLVPGKLIDRAISVLDRDIFNAEFESQWRAHLEMLSDDELRVMEPQYAFCGLYDRIERINRAYDEELERRGLNE